MKSDQQEEKGVRKTKRDRYWSVMLVGDHGRIIPFRRFKGLAIGVICLLVVSIVALAIVSLLFVHQKQKVADLHSELQVLRQQATELRDEKDLYLTQLIVKQEQTSGPSKKKNSSKARKAVAPPAKPTVKTTPKVAAKKPPEAPKPKPVDVKWAADIRRFKTTYSPDRKVLNAEFRIYNTSKPKKPLAGRTVVVFKNLDETPIHWFPVPPVQLKNGEPTGDKGQAFKINNYRTVKFRAYGQKAPVKFNTATVFIFSDKGKLLVSKDFGFKIAYRPPPPAKPKTPPKPATVTPAPAGKTSVSKDGSRETTQSATGQEAPPVAPDASNVTTSPPENKTVDKVEKATDVAIDIPEATTPENEYKPPASQKDGDNPATDGDIPSVPSADTPTPDLKPKNQGEPQ